jgi:hypothetical protein
MKVSVIGAGKRRNGIGEYIAKYFHENGARVTAVLGKTEESSKQASLSLTKYGIEAHPYTDFFKMVGNEMPDAVVIASPSSTHYDYLLKCIDSALNVFCEKPFVLCETDEMERRVEEILTKANEKGLIVAMNSQWPFSIPSYETICGKIEVQKINHFLINLSPGVRGREMIPVSVPHALSLLYHVFGPGKIQRLSFESDEARKMTIHFEYLFDHSKCEVFINLTTQEKQPRDLSFGFNDRMVSRNLDLNQYAIYFNYRGLRVRISDPLELSVQNFIEALEKKLDPLIGYSHIQHNMMLLKKINDGYIEFATKKRN